MLVREMKHCAICGRTAVKTCVKCKRCVCGAIGRCRGKEWRVGKGKAVICQACLSSGPPVVVQGRSFGRISKNPDLFLVSIYLELIVLLIIFLVMVR